MLITIDTVMHHAEGLENYISRTAGLIFLKVRLCGDLRLYRIRNWTGIEWSPSGLVEVFRSRRITHGEPKNRSFKFCSLQSRVLKLCINSTPTNTLSLCQPPNNPIITGRGICILAGASPMLMMSILTVGKGQWCGRKHALLPSK